MRRLLASLIVPSMLLVNACASSPAGSAPVGARPATQTIGGDGVGSVTVTSNTSADVSHLPYSADAVFRILPSIYDSLGITVSSLDPASRTIGNPGYKTRAKLGKAPLSRYLDCGGSTQIGPNADSYDVFLSVMSTVAAEGASGSVLSTIVEAKARPVIVSQAYSNCSSKGSIEIKIADLVKARLSK
jgi:hypothetical protein